MVADIIDAEQCAEMLRCTPDQIEELARAGEIPGLKIGRAWIFVRADLLIFLAEKARAEAQQRRAKRQPGAIPPLAKPRRQVPPVLPVPPPGGSRPTGPHAGDVQKTQESPRRSRAIAERPLDHGRLYVPVAEAARMLSMGKSTFWREVKNKNVPAPVKIGGLTRWRIADLERFVEGLRS